MPTSLRFLGLPGFLLLAAISAPAAPDVPVAAPAAPTPPPVALPAYVDVVSFAVDFEDEKGKIVTTVAPNALRVDAPDDGYSLIYDPQTERYTGLEHKNYTYWQFSWPEVRAAVETSKRYETRLQELSNEGLNGDASPAPPSAPSTASVSGSGAGDDTGYVWRPTTDKKRIANLDCIRWTGDTVSGEHVEAWCYGALLPKVQAAVAQLQTVDEPMALVPIRMVVPEFIFPVYTSLTKAGVTPILITWGDQRQPNRFQLVDVKTRAAKPDLFAVPKLYVKTTLITMDGLIDQKK